MKMTLHIDEALLEEVMVITGARTKTRAIELALLEMKRRHKMKRFFAAAKAVPDADWADAWDDHSAPEAALPGGRNRGWGQAERLAENPPRSRRRPLPLRKR
jgi:Arc/MetJ family transcription regulator